VFFTCIMVLLLFWFAQHVLFLVLSMYCDSQESAMNKLSERIRTYIQNNTV
jgi:hypothetical protein